MTRQSGYIFPPAGGASSLLDEVILSTAANVIVLDHSQMVVGESYRLDVEGSTTNSAVISIFVNGDFVDSNYYRREFQSNTVSTGAGAASASEIGSNNILGPLRISCEIFSHSGLFNWQSTCAVRSSSLPGLHFITGEKNALITEFTGLELRATTGWGTVNFGVGTRARLSKAVSI